MFQERILLFILIVKSFSSQQIKHNQFIAKLTRI